MVLNEKQRLAKRKLIEENRVRRKLELSGVKPKTEQETPHEQDSLSEDDKILIQNVTSAYPYPMEVESSFDLCNDTKVNID